nr:immunoglobulin light chain junction region [Macaca mulatta]MOW16938.1 immunoglobulin light chain junction region [Macaca mulatta]
DYYCGSYRTGPTYIF